MKPVTIRKDSSTHAPEFENIDIFKYGSLKDVKRTLENCTLGFSKLESYNDPFETNFAYRHHFINEISRDIFFSQTFGPKETNADRIRRLADEYLSEFMVTCFSSTPYEPLMWAHYADKHNGVCYCFDKKTVFDKGIYRFGNVRYSSHLPVLDYFENRSSFEQLKPQLNDIILVKSAAWVYEKEFRFFLKSDKATHCFNAESLQSVIIGSRLLGKPESDEIEKLVSEYNSRNNLDVKVLYARISTNTYSMNIGYNKSPQKPPVTCPIYDPSAPVI